MPSIAHPLDRSRISTSSLRVELGGVVAELSTTDQDWIAALSERFKKFLTEASPHLLIHHEPDRTGPPVECLPSGVEFRLNAGARTEFVDGVLRTRLPELAAPALVTHAALLSGGGRGFLCCGPPGAGKSTLAGMVPDHALCDELALARVAGGVCEGISLPYWDARPGRVPLAGIFILEHAAEHWRRRLSPAAAARALKANVYWPTREAAALREAFATLAEIVVTVPVWRLGFAPNPDVWRTITRSA